ncbi:MAG: hypothetical protein GF331_25635 [Chitinivibrionales bacterium]|nr:hypothetical protein [Chitinivibrionales bacterium]
MSASPSLLSCSAVSWNRCLAGRTNRRKDRMNAEYAEVLTRELADVVERMAFMFAEPGDPSELDLDGEPWMGVNMSFRGSLNGTISLAAPRALCVELAGNILGLTSDDEKAQRYAGDAFRELLNVVCGQVLTSLAGRLSTFDLAAPVSSEVDAGSLALQLHTGDALLFSVDDTPCVLRISFVESTA